MKFKDLMEYKDASPEEFKQAIEYYNEYYGIGIKKAGKNKYINDPEEIKACHRRYNQLKRDAMDVTSRAGDLIPHDDVTEFMNDACDAWDWEREYKEFGFEAALKLIVSQAAKDVDNKYKNTETILAQLISKWECLRKLNGREKREKRRYDKG